MTFSVHSTGGGGIDEKNILLNHARQDNLHVGHALPSQGQSRLLQPFFHFYKTYISSQDHMSCVFHPSCSEYALESIQKQGLLPGLLNTFDRLTRCNGLRPQDYMVEPRLRKLYDPVRNIHYEEL